MNKLLLGALLLAASFGAGAQDKKTCYNMDAAFENQMGYCQAVRVGNTLYTGGYPVATWVQVPRLFTPALVVEVELVATFPAK